MSVGTFVDNKIAKNKGWEQSQQMLHLLVKIISKHGGSGIDKIHESSSIIAMASTNISGCILQI